MIKPRRAHTFDGCKAFRQRHAQIIHLANSKEDAENIDMKIDDINETWLKLVSRLVGSPILLTLTLSARSERRGREAWIGTWRISGIVFRE